MHHFYTNFIGQNEAYDPTLSSGKAGREAGKYSLFVFPKRRNWICEHQASLCHKRGLHLVVIKIRELIYVKYSEQAQHIGGIHDVRLSCKRSFSDFALITAC